MKRNRISAQQRGVSLIETVMTMAVLAVTTGTLLPSLSSMTQRHRLEGAAAQLETEMQYARGLAVKERRAVRFSFRADAEQSCYVIHTGGPNACVCQGETAVCTGNAEALRTVAYTASGGLRVASNSASFMFDPIKGTVTPTATIELGNARGDALRLVVNILGRVRSCTTTGMSGHKAC
jgi:type IV fimbrial biogenesis protein FimT